MLFDTGGRLFRPYPEWLLTFYHVQSYIVSGISIICCATLILVVLRHSPREMGAFKWYIIASSLSSLICELLMGICHPLPLSPYPLLLASGAISTLVDPSTTVTHVYASALVLSTVIMVCCNAAMFAFRFLQSVDSKRIRLMAEPKTALCIAFAVVSVFSVGLLLPLNFALISVDNVKTYAEHNDPELFRIIRNRGFVGAEAKLNWWSAIFLTFLIIGGVLTSVVLISSAIGCQYFIRSSSRPLLSERTLRLYKMLANALVIDLTLSLVIFVVPVVVACASFVGGYENAGTVATLCVCCVLYYPIATNVLILIYVTPYRRGLMRMARIPIFISPSVVTAFESRIK